MSLYLSTPTTQNGKDNTHFILRRSKVEWALFAIHDISMTSNLIENPTPLYGIYTQSQHTTQLILPNRHHLVNQYAFLHVLIDMALNPTDSRRSFLNQIDSMNRNLRRLKA